MHAPTQALLALLFIQPALGEILTPPYFNLALNKKITATATCGDEGPELYCKLVGSNADQDTQILQGQVCDYCNASMESKRHPPEYAVDDTDTWWQSPPLSRGMKYNEVNLTIDLGQEFHVAYVFVRMGNSPRPGLWVLEKSTDYGKNFKPWQYFSDSPQDCERYFGRESLMPISRDDSVICSTEFSKIVPLEGGEIPISLLISRPSANKYFNSSVLQEWTRATNVRLRLLRTKNLLGHLMSVARQDPTVTRRYFYSIKDIEIGGRCMCNGHANNCGPSESKTNILVCRCQHNTCGPQCGQCCSGFEQKKWRISESWDKFECEPCNCHNHSSECEYDPTVDEQGLSLDVRGRYEGGGVCRNCQHNTEGINCNKCKPTFYRPYGKKWHEIDVCSPCQCDYRSTGNCAELTGQCECRKEFQPPLCDSCAYGYFDYPDCKPCTCNLNGTEGSICTPDGGICPCKYNYAGDTCMTCADGYYSPECKSCECNTIGSVSGVCDKTSGNCTCKSKYAGRTCNQCEAGYYNYPTCSHCNCDVSGTLPNICDDVTGQCICKEGFGGARCDQCIAGYYMEVQGRERVCVPCNCSAKGSTSRSCAADGKCNCLSNFGGKRCDQCSPGYYKFPECLGCDCDLSGSIGYSCDDYGNCHCKSNFDGNKCDHCKEHFYNYPACEECNCDPRGVIATFAGCGSVPAGELCQCKERVQGRICNSCKPLFWNLQEYNPVGCQECDCNTAGTLGGIGTCDTKTGQCFCKHHVGERQCNQCEDGFYRLKQDNVYGCTECNCDVGGSIDNNCDKITGQCRCNSRVEGRRCDRPISAHYFPTLHQFQYEVEEGLTPSGAVRYRNSDEIFPGYSWKGYVVFSPIQSEVIYVIHISKSSLYHMVLKYANPTREPVLASIIITPESVIDIQQKFTVLLRPTNSPQFETVAGDKGLLPSPLVMNPGNWNITIKTSKAILVDYFVLIPQAYFEATMLTKLVDKPCIVGDLNLCRDFAFPSLNGRPIADKNDLVNTANKYIDNQEQLAALNAGSNEIPLLDGTKSELQYNMRVEPNGLYVFLVEYVTPVSNVTELEEFDSNSSPYEFSTKGLEHMDVIVKLIIGNSIILVSPPMLRRFFNSNLHSIYRCPAHTNDCICKCERDFSDSSGGLVEETTEYTWVTARIQGESQKEELTGTLYLNDCPYTRPCRQVLTDALSRVYMIHVQDTNNVVYLGGEPDTLVGIKAIYAIPEQDWHLDYITPRPYCLMKDGNCSPAVFTAAVDSKKVEIESGQGGDRGTRPPIFDNSTVVVYLNTNPVTIESKVSTPGEYMFIVHYYQPDSPQNNIDVFVSSDGQHFEAVLPIEHCPSNSGCRALLKQADGNTRFPINENVTITFKSGNGKGVWLDYAQIVASPDFMDSALKESNRLDYTREFINKCAMNHYRIETNVTGFCRDSVFSITSDYNSGTLACFCDVVGSLDLECETFGGQCKCRPNVIGRTCSSCRPGYYGFPNCKPCNCPSTAVCDDYGTCQCPPNVEGENCDRCKPYTFNFDEFRGCDDCNCNPLGVVNNRLQCDSDNGKCSCKMNVIGRICDHCVPGHYSFPACYQCHCHVAGTTDEVCDQNTAQCFCKKYVRGQACDVCKEEYFNLEPSNPLGCTKCYCFGKTTRCLSGQLYWAEISGMWDWYLVTVEKNTTLQIFPHSTPVKLINDSVIGADHRVGENKVIYFGAPHQYLGKRLTSYGGNLKYTIFYTFNGGHAISAADIIIGGNNGFIVHNSIEQPPAVVNWLHSVRMTEEEFTNLDGSAVTRDQFMNVLLNITAIYIRATYWQDAVTTRLISVSLDVGVEDWSDDARLASSVEQCQCPPAYRGLSCEQCAEGHHRLSSGPHAGYCVPCQCNGHSNTCDVNTGRCLNCDDNTMGDHCEMCVPGFHGDATVGTPNDCLICACPMPIPSNNFAIGCELSGNGELISCECRPGYGGARCEFCAAGYYGQPEVLGDYCKPCNCSGNINVEDPESCDSVTGDCLKCVNNTTGTACNLCAPGFFGEAIFSKNCTPCFCDEYGMERCDATTGICQCRPGVIGDRCDQCEPDHYGLQSGRGCSPCNCGEASLSSQCDETGQCKCASGAAGKHCEKCAAGFWNYSKAGCIHCNCNKNYSIGFTCNAIDGQCECVNGAIGEKCDRCPDRWVLIPNQFCMECDSCTDALLISVEYMRDLLANETQDFKDKADSFFTTQRLNYISNQTNALRPKVADLKNVDLNDVTNAVNDVESTAKNLLRSAEFAATDSEKQAARANVFASDAVNVLASVREHAAKASTVIAHIGELATGLELSQQPKVDSALSEARLIKNGIEEKDFEPMKEQANSALTHATEQLERMNVFVQPVNNQTEKFEALVKGNKKLNSDMEDLTSFTKVALETAAAADKLNANNRKSKFGNKVSSVSKQNTAALEDLVDAAYSINKALVNHALALQVAENATKALNDLDNSRSDMELRIKQLQDEIPDLKTLTDEAEDHASTIRSRADSLRRLAERENKNSRTQQAYSAASAYSSIVKEISDAKEAVAQAESNMDDIIAANNKLQERLSPALERSNSFRDQAVSALDTVKTKLQPNLTNAERGLAAANQTLLNANQENEAIAMTLPAASQFTLSDEIAKASKVNDSVQNTLKTMSQLGKDLEESKGIAQLLPKVADEAVKTRDNVQHLLNDMEQNVNPQIANTYRLVKSKQEELERKRRDAEEKLLSLKAQVDQARAVANRIQVGVSFDSMSTLQPQLPDTVDDMSTSSHVSAYFKTKEKNGLILYLGNPKGTNLRRTTSDDFMVIEMQNGYPYLIMDIGDGAKSGREPAKIGNDKFVADDKWYQVVVDRVGRNVKFTIRESLDNGTDVSHEKEAVLPGQHTIFNLDKDKSKLYVGGAPSDANLQGISYPAFDGKIEELMIGDTPVGLWNFVEASNLKGARQRDKLVSSQSGPKEYRFNGRSHVTVPGGKHLQPENNQLQLFFRTYAPDGLIYLTGDKTHFFSIQMQDGRVFLQVSLGNPDDLVILGTTKTYNDGKWHKLDAQRILNVCALKIDNEPPIKQEATGKDSYIQSIDSMNFGGNNMGIVQVTNKGFDGCLRKISMASVNIDLSENTESVGMAYGCQFASLVSLSGDDSYLRFKDITTENLELTLKFKTSEPEGLLFVLLSRTQTTTKQDSISLSMNNGKLELMSQQEVLDTAVGTYNDSQWHVITVTHNENALRLVIDDDYERLSTDHAPAPLHILDGVLFIGGIQPKYVLGSKVATRRPFQGCIADATVNGRVLNLLEPYSNGSVTFGRCGTTTTTGGVAPDQTLWPVTMRPDVLPTAAPPVTTPPEVETRGGFATREGKTQTPPPQVVPVTTTQAPVMKNRIPPPPPEKGCALAYDPYYTIGDPEEGYRFGTRNDSRIEYSKLPGRQHDGFDLTIELRTFDEHGGLLFYAAAENSPRQFLSLYMKDGLITFTYNCGGDTTLLQSSLTYTDTKWHTVTIVRNEGRGKLSVDNELIGETSTICVAPAALAAPFYYGGLKDLTPDIKMNLETFYQPFKGCLKGLMMNGQRVTQIMNRVNALQCHDDIEEGVFFGPSLPGSKNYLKLKGSFRIGYEVSISFEVKPRNSTGLLMAVHGARDYMVLELLENELVANVENGKGPFHASFKLADKFSLCDGNWHKIHAVKSRHVVSVGVDGRFSDPGLGVSGSTDTKSALFIGGHERHLSRVRGVRSRHGFSGCIRNIVIKETQVQIPPEAAHGNVHIGVCPLH